MRILADENCPGDLVDALCEAGHDVLWVRTAAPGSSDPMILAWAQREKRLILTFDKDFGELAIRHRLPASYGIILCRLHGIRPARICTLVCSTLAMRVEWGDTFTVLSEQQIRIIPLSNHSKQ